jgi:hypothetical protein
VSHKTEKFDFSINTEMVLTLLPVLILKSVVHVSHTPYVELKQLMSVLTLICS